MYHYHYNKGLPAIVLTEFCAVCSLGFTVAFSVFLLGFINWAGLMECHDEGSCHDLHSYVVTTHFGFSSLFGFIIMGYCFLFSCYWIFRLVTALQVISSAIEMERFYRCTRMSHTSDKMFSHPLVLTLLLYTYIPADETRAMDCREKLGISLAELHALDWNDVVQRLIVLHDHKIHRVAVKDQLTEHDVVSRILRKENYMVALINKVRREVCGVTSNGLVVERDRILVTVTIPYPPPGRAGSTLTVVGLPLPGVRQAVPDQVLGVESVLLCAAAYIQ